MIMKRTIIRILVLALMMLSWGVETRANSVASTSGSHDKDIRNGKVVLTGKHATFTLSGTEDIQYKSRFGALDIDAYDLCRVSYNSSKYLTLSWEVDEGYTIKVTKISFWMRAYISNLAKVGSGKVVFNGQTKKAGSIWVLENENEGAKFAETNTSGFANGIQIECKNALTGWTNRANTFDFMMKNLVIEYTITPIINTQNASVRVTVCDEDTKTVDLSACVTNKIEHLSYTYALTGSNKDKATLTGTTFSSKTVGTYTVQVTAAGVNNCHSAKSETFTVSVTPASLTLTAPTASDITYPGTLATSTLTGGKAMAGSCEVEGSWAWQSPGTKPAIGDNQSFPVVFTPSTAAGNYTTATTNATVNVVACIFTGQGDDDDRADIWGKNDNWNVNTTPDSDNVVLIRHDAIIEDEVAAYSVVIEDGYTLTIMPTGGLTVGKGGIIGATQDNLILRAGQEGDEKGQTGYLRIDPESAQPMPAATVELYCKAYYNKAERETSKAAWQMVGVPISNEGVAAKSVFTKSWIYNWDEESNDWVNNRATLTFAPFVGYETTQYKYPEGILLVFTGNLVDGNSVKSIDLTHDGYGYNALANSFMAPIDISRMDESDFVNAEAAVNILNMGTQEQSKNPVKSVDAPGQYISIPVKSAEVMADKFNYPLVVPPMQGFFVKAKGDGAKVNLDYSKLVWGVDYSDLRDTKPLRAPERMTESSTIGALKITIAANELVDHAYLLESADYDAAYENGYDALKMQSGDVNIFTIEGNEQLAVDATNSIAGTRIGVRTGDTTAYVMTFTHLNAEPLALYDRETNLTLDIEEGTEYTFYAAPNSVITDRFQILKRANSPAVTTGIEEINNGVRAQKFIQDGQFLILKNGVLYTATGAVVR